jgi:hypothetical protein
VAPVGDRTACCGTRSAPGRLGPAAPAGSAAGDASARPSPIAAAPVVKAASRSPAPAAACPEPVGSAPCGTLSVFVGFGPAAPGRSAAAGAASPRPLSALSAAIANAISGRLASGMRSTVALFDTEPAAAACAPPAAPADGSGADATELPATRLPAANEVAVAAEMRETSPPVFAVGFERRDDAAPAGAALAVGEKPPLSGTGVATPAGAAFAADRSANRGIAPGIAMVSPGALSCSPGGAERPAGICRRMASAARAVLVRPGGAIRAAAVATALSRCCGADGSPSDWRACVVWSKSAAWPSTDLKLSGSGAPLRRPRPTPDGSAGRLAIMTCDTATCRLLRRRDPSLPAT